MVIKNWVLPILIGLVAAIALISILYNNPKVKAYFTDVGVMTQLQSDQLVQLNPNNHNTNMILFPINNSYNDNKKISNSGKINNASTNKMTTINSPLYTGENIGEPIYNYYPKV